jgi:hypothetical protein
MNNDYEQERDDEESRYVPSSSLDYNLLLTNTVWGDNTQVQSYFKKLCTTYEVLRDVKGEMQRDENNNILINEKNLWNMLSFFTRDFRLGNLTPKDIVYCEHYTNLASDYLEVGFVEFFFICLTRVAGRLELSQSRGGFFRKQSNTMISERVSRQEAPRKGLLSNKGKEV